MGRIAAADIAEAPLPPGKSAMAGELNAVARRSGAGLMHIGCAVSHVAAIRYRPNSDRATRFLPVLERESFARTNRRTIFGKPIGQGKADAQ